MKDERPNPRTRQNTTYINKKNTPAKYHMHHACNKSPPSGAYVQMKHSLLVQTFGETISCRLGDGSVGRLWVLLPGAKVFPTSPAAAALRKIMLGLLGPDLYVSLWPSSKASKAAGARKLGRRGPSSKASKVESMNVEIGNLEGKAHPGKQAQELARVEPYCFIYCFGRVEIRQQ